MGLGPRPRWLICFAFLLDLNCCKRKLHFCIQNGGVYPIVYLNRHPAILLLAAAAGADQVAERIAIALCANAAYSPSITHVNDDLVDVVLFVHFDSPFVLRWMYLNIKKNTSGLGVFPTFQKKFILV